MLLYELVRLQKTTDDKRERQRHRLSARQLRAQIRERDRAEKALMEVRGTPPC